MGLMKRSVGWKLEELDRILNDPTAPMEAHRVWSLLDDISGCGASEDFGSGGEQRPPQGV
jgi:hypothetical protein